MIIKKSRDVSWVGFNSRDPGSIWTRDISRDFLKNPGISRFHYKLVQKMEKRIKNQVKPASLTSATTGRTINLKTVQKELDLFDATGERTPRMLKIMRAIETIPPTSVEAERAFSAAGLFITKLRTRLNNRSVDALCFLRAYYKKN